MLVGGILSIDPGSVNHSISITLGDRCIYTEMTKRTIHKLGGPELDSIIVDYSTHIADLLDQYKPRAVVVERFVVRGFAHNSIELVGFMCAIVKTLCMARAIPCYLITANQWKSPVKKALKLKDLYKEFRRKPYKITPHTIDSLLIGRYIYNKRIFTERDEAWIRETLINLNKKPRFQFRLNQQIQL